MSPPNDNLDPNYVSPFPFKGGMSLADLGKRPEPPKPEPQPAEEQSDAAALLAKMNGAA